MVLRLFTSPNWKKMSLVSAELIAAYCATEYRVDAPGACITLRIDQPSVALADLQQSFGVACSAFLTACNPYSVPVPSGQNTAAHHRLLEDLKGRPYRWLPGAGVDPTGRWPAEPSVLVLGMPLEQAMALAKKFHQNGFVFCDADAVPRLVLTR